MIPPPRENPTMENPPEAAPVQDSEEDAVVKNICIAKSRESCGTSRGVSE